jgi:flagellar motility protein MotE (MotC chaperone)
MGRVLKALGLVLVSFLVFIGLLHGVLVVRHRHTPEALNSFHDWPVIGGFFPKQTVQEKQETPEERREKEAAAWLEDSRNEFKMPPPVTTAEVETLVRELKDARSQADEAKERYTAGKSDLDRARKEVETERKLVHETGDLISTKLNDIKADAAELDRQRRFVEGAETKNFKMLAAMYEAMPPEEAAKRLGGQDSKGSDSLDVDTAARLLSKMPDKKAGKILGAMDTPRAVLITKKLQALPREEAARPPTAAQPR